MNKPAPLPSPGSHAFRRARGFTLIELLVVISIFGILMGVALPSMGNVMGSARLNAASDEFIAALHLARGEAIKRRARVTLCKSADGARCIASGGWDQGWLVFDDADDDGWRGDSETLLHHHQALDGRVKLTGNMNVARYVTFSAAGSTQLTNGGFQAGTLTFCQASASPTRARQVILNATGRPRLQKVTVASC